MNWRADSEPEKRRCSPRTWGGSGEIAVAWRQWIISSSSAVKIDDMFPCRSSLKASTFRPVLSSVQGTLALLHLQHLLSNSIKIFGARLRLYFHFNVNYTPEFFCV